MVTDEIGRKRVGEGPIGLSFLVRADIRRKGIVERLAGLFFSFLRFDTWDYIPGLHEGPYIMGEVGCFFYKKLVRGTTSEDSI